MPAQQEDSTKQRTSESPQPQELQVVSEIRSQVEGLLGRLTALQEKINKLRKIESVESLSEEIKQSEAEKESFFSDVFPDFFKSPDVIGWISSHEEALKDIMSIVTRLQSFSFEGLREALEEQKERLEKNKITNEKELQEKLDYRESLRLSLEKARSIAELRAILADMFETTAQIESYLLERLTEANASKQLGEPQEPADKGPGDVDEPEDGSGTTFAEAAGEGEPDAASVDPNAEPGIVTPNVKPEFVKPDTATETVHPSMSLKGIVEAAQANRFKRFISQWNVFSETAVVANRRNEGKKLNGEELAVMQYLRSKEPFALDEGSPLTVNKPHQAVLETLSEVLKIRNIDALLARCIVAKSKDGKIDLKINVLSPNEIEAFRKLFMLTNKVLGNDFPISSAYFTGVSQNIGEDEINGLIESVKEEAKKDTIKKPGTLFRGELLETREETEQMLREILEKRKDLLYLLFEKSVPEGKPAEGDSNPNKEIDQSKREELIKVKKQVMARIEQLNVSPDLTSNPDRHADNLAGAKVFLKKLLERGIPSAGETLLNTPGLIEALVVESKTNPDIKKLIEQLNA